METTMTLPTVALKAAGQSPWLDNISRELLRSGRLRSMIEESGLLGVTSNPTIFEKAISCPGGGYSGDIRRLSRRGASTFEIYDALTISDIRQACDLFMPVYRKTAAEDGFVSLEVSPELAHDTRGTVEEAHRLFKAVGRPNLMIKVPATEEGIPAVRELISAGISVNATLIFSVRHYTAVADAYLDGLEALSRSGRAGKLTNVRSVASVFVSRFDTLIDKKLAGMLAAGTGGFGQADIRACMGRSACANSKLVYREFAKIFSSGRFRSLEMKGAAVQRLLWGSTGTKNPDYSDLLYVESLVGPQTVNTMPEPTLEALLDHGQIRPNSVGEGLEEALRTADGLKRLGLDLEETGEVLQREGVRAFAQSFESLMAVIETRRMEFSARRPSTKTVFTLGAFGGSIDACVRGLEEKNFHARFLKGDPTVWKTEEEHQRSIRNRLGWVRVTGWMMGRLHELDAAVAQARKDGIRDVVLLGMGGSSLAPIVMNEIFPRRKGFPRLSVLDSTDPEMIAKLEKKLFWPKTLVIVSSKSGGTVETLTQFRYFFDRASKKLRDRAGRQFMAVTDSGSQLEKTAREKNFRKIFINPSDIGGRYSALSYFGLLPAALSGIDVRSLVYGAHQFLKETEVRERLPENPGIYLGAVLGELANSGRDKLTFWMSKSLAVFGGWAEQLIAESTGKEGKGIVPVVGDEPAQASDYGNNRVFAVITLRGEKNTVLAGKVRQLKKSGFAVLETVWPDRNAIGREFLRWEIATAAASAVMGINPFDEPNVTESKDAAKTVLAGLKGPGAKSLSAGVVRAAGPFEFGALFSKLAPQGYVALLAYTGYEAQIQKAFERLQTKLRDALKVPVLFGFGPRYLHSIGQLYKGGTGNGLFIEFMMRDKKDLAIPGEDFTFGQLKTAQALGDFRALSGRGRPILAVDLGADVLAGMRVFESCLDRYFESPGPAAR